MSIRKLMNYWFQKSRDGFYIFFGILAAGLYALGTALGFYLQEAALSWALKLSAVILAIFLGLFYLVHKNLHSLHHFWDMFHQTDHFPEKQLAHVNAFCMTVFLLISALVLSVVPPLFDPLWAWIWRGLQYLTRTSSSAPVEILCYVKPARSASLSCGTGRRNTCMDEIHRPDHGHFCSAPAFTSDSPDSASDCPVHLDIFHQAETL